MSRVSGSDTRLQGHDVTVGMVEGTNPELVNGASLTVRERAPL